MRLFVAGCVLCLFVDWSVLFVCCGCSLLFVGCRGLLCDVRRCLLFAGVLHGVVAVGVFFA